MTQHRSPNNPEKCFFHIQPTSVLTAEESIVQCVRCMTRGNQQLQSLKADFHQIAYQATLEAKAEYDPADQRGASLITFARDRVCGTLRNTRRKALKSIPFPTTEGVGDTESLGNNPLVDGLVADACQHEGVDEEVIRCVEVEQFERLLPQLLLRLSDKEQTVLKLKFFEGHKGVEIAEVLGVTKGRVSQLTHAALAKLKKAYLNASEQLSEKKRATETYRTSD